MCYSEEYYTHLRTPQVTRDVPGIDAAYLAMDTEEGVEVVWNEVRYSHRRMVKGRRVSVSVGLRQSDML